MNGKGLKGTFALTIALKLGLEKNSNDNIRMKNRLKKIEDKNHKTHSCPIISPSIQSVSHFRDEVKSIPSILRLKVASVE